jgi:transposase InsO family protein
MISIKSVSDNASIKSVSDNASIKSVGGAAKRALSDDEVRTLREIYYNPEEGFLGWKGLYKKAKLKGIPVTQKMVKEWLAKQRVVQLHTSKPTIKHYFPIKAAYKDHIWQADLLDVSNMAHENRGINYCLCVIDIASRYAWVKPLKNKTAKVVAKAMDEIITSSNRHPKIMSSDNGSEFIASEFQNLMQKYEIESSFNEPGDHKRMGIVERFNKTLRGLIERYRSATQQGNFVDVLQKIVDNYNHTEHSSLDSTPANPDFEKARKILEKKELMANKDLRAFDLGDQVRFLKNPKMFEKGSLPKWSEQTLYIKKINRLTYKLSNDVTKKYYELLKVPAVENGPEYEPPEVAAPVIRKKKTRLALRKEGVEDENIQTRLRQRVQRPLVDYSAGYHHPMVRF